MIAMVVLIAVLFLVIWRIKQRRSTAYRLNTLLKPYAEDELRQFIIPDGMGGLLEVERLILLKQGLLLLDSYSMQGYVFGAAHIEQWTQIIEGKSYPFTNPLHRIHNARQALQAIIADVPVYCHIVFTEANFPKGKPEGVSTLDTLAVDLQFLHRQKQIPEKSRQAWNRILRIARQDGKPVRRSGSHHGG